MRNIIEVHLTDDSKGEAQQFLVSYVVPLASYSWLISIYVQADTLEAYLIYMMAQIHSELYM